MSGPPSAVFFPPSLFPADPLPSRPSLANVLTEIQKESPGGWAAWKAAKLAKEYEAQGGGYENVAGSKNEPKAGVPEHKSEYGTELFVRECQREGWMGSQWMDGDGRWDNFERRQSRGRIAASLHTS